MSAVGSGIQGAPTARVLFIEGVPGTGKSTAARRIHRWLGRQGFRSEWWREEDPGHPATPKALRASASLPGFAERCLEHWREFARRPGTGADRCVLEGSAFQSTIRFMLEQETPREGILAYVGRFSAVVAPLEPRLAYFETEDPRRFLSGFVAVKRGPEWVEKVSAHLASTPFCVARGWSGPAGVVEFWLRYAELCEEALGALDFPVLRVTTGPGRWSGAHAELVAWITPTLRDGKPPIPPR